MAGMFAPGPSGEISLGQSAGLVSLFVGTAAWCTVTNKQILIDILADSNFLFLMQGVGTIVLLHLGRALGWVDPSVVKPDPHNRNQIIIAVAYTANVAFGLCSLNYVSIPMFGALKRMTILACWIGEFLIDRTPATYSVIPALFVMVLGTVVAGWNDLEFHFLGYIFGIASCAGQGVAFVLSKTVAKSEGSSGKGSLSTVLGVVYLNSVVSSVLMVVVIWATTGWDSAKLWRQRGRDDPWLATAHVGTNVLSVLFLNVVIFLDCTLNTPLTHAVAGNLKAAVTSLAGLLVFGTVLTNLGLAGLVLNLVGGVWYSMMRVSVKKQPKTAEHCDADASAAPVDPTVAMHAQNDALHGRPAPKMEIC